MYASHADLFKEAEEPDWVTAWLSKREEKAEKKEQKEKSETPVDEEDDDARNLHLLQQLSRQ